MTVWLVNAFWDLPQEGNRPQRYWLMAEAFAHAGYDVVYWTSDFSHITKKPRILRDVDVVGHSYKANGVRVVLLPTKPYQKNISLKRILSHRALAKTFRRASAGETRKPDLVVACTPPLSLCDAAREAARVNGAKFICDIQDAWPETFERVAPRFMLAPLRAVARRIYRDADAIVATGKRYTDLAAAYGATSPMRELTQVIAPRARPTEKKPPMRELTQVIAPRARSAEKKPPMRELTQVIAPRARPTEKAPDANRALRLVYCGNMSKSYDLATLVDAVMDSPDATLDLAGNGPDRAALESKAASCPRIRFHGYLGESELADLLDSCDVGVIPMFPESCVAVPGKMADYAAAGLRVIECLGGECTDILCSVRAGAHYEPQNAASLKAAIKQVQNLNPDFASFRKMFDGVSVMDSFVRFAGALAGNR